MAESEELARLEAIEHNTRGSLKGSVDGPAKRIGRWLEEEHKDPEELRALMGEVTAFELLGWETKVMKKILVALDEPMENYTNPECVKAMMKIFFSSESQTETPVLSRESSKSKLVDSAGEVVPGLGAPLAGDKSGSGSGAGTAKLEELLAIFSQQISGFKSEMKSEMSILRSEVRHPPRPSVQHSGGMPSAADFFGAVESAVHERLSDGLGNMGDAPSSQGASGWAFYPPSTPGGMPTTRAVPPLIKPRHSRPGGNEDVYTPSKEQFYPFREYMFAHRSDWQNVSLFREGLTEATVLDQLALLPDNLASLEPLRDAREILVRRWICLKFVASRTKRGSTPTFSKFALGFESLMVQDSPMPEAALLSAMANSKYETKILKAQDE